MICATVWATVFCRPIRLDASFSRAWTIDDMATAQPAFFNKGCVSVRLDKVLRWPCSGNSERAVDSDKVPPVGKASDDVTPPSIWRARPCAGQGFIGAGQGWLWE